MHPLLQTAKCATSRFRLSTSMPRPAFTKRFSVGRSDAAATAVSRLTTPWARWAARGWASKEPGLLIYIMVDSVTTTIDAVTAHGGSIVQPIGIDAPEVTARFSDPSGNVIGLHQEPTGRKETWVKAIMTSPALPKSSRRAFSTRFCGKMWTDPKKHPSQSTRSILPSWNLWIL